MGKTELARAICAELYGDERRLIRLAMSEYAHDWAVSRLVGPMPGYVRSAGPESWLTTRVRHQPDTAVLLDEIEKAHPTVWNTFLEVLDVGWLSDSCGTSTDFSRTVVMMSSNLGAKAFSSRPIGFDPSPERVEPAEGRVLDAVKGAMAPELVNRLDGVVVVHPLPSKALVEQRGQGGRGRRRPALGRGLPADHPRRHRGPIREDRLRPCAWRPAPAPQHRAPAAAAPGLGRGPDGDRADEARRDRLVGDLAQRLVSIDGKTIDVVDTSVNAEDVVRAAPAA